MNTKLKINAPEGATHYRRGFNNSIRFFISRDHSHFVWLGKGHGGWSFELPYAYPNRADLTKLEKGSRL